jgi:nucleotide sugar dehydrogenase
MKSVGSLAQQLRSGELQLVVWGGGYVGLSSALHFAAQNIRCRIQEVDSTRAANIQAGLTGLPLFETWMDIPLAPLVNSGMVHATADAYRGRGAVHIIAIPTERNGVPWRGAIDDVVDQIMRTDPILCIVESTLTPGTCDDLKVAYPDIPLALAPRRDWFLAEGKDLRSLPRVYAGLSPAVAAAAASVLSIVSSNLLRASSCAVAELTKCLENGLHHMAALYATQMARAFPQYDVNEAFSLAASHWRIGNSYFASAGTGGHCLPVATNHLLAAADQPVLTICSAAHQFEFEQRDYIARLIGHQITGPVGIIGLAYRAEVPTTTLSPSVDVALRLAYRGVVTYVHDPYCASTVVRDHPTLTIVDFPEILTRSHRIFIGAGHQVYRRFTGQDVIRYLRRGQIVFDNEGTWTHLRSDLARVGVVYRRIGDAGWSDDPM